MLLLEIAGRGICELCAFFLLGRFCVFSHLGPTDLVSGLMQVELIFTFFCPCAVKLKACLFILNGSY